MVRRQPSTQSSVSSEPVEGLLPFHENAARNTYPSVLINDNDPGRVSQIDQIVVGQPLHGPVTVDLGSPYANSEIRYTTNEKNPTTTSHLYTAPSDPTSAAEALRLLRSYGASKRLVRHGELVAEVAAAISREIARLGVLHDSVLVVVGATLHDCGKIIHPEELTGPGYRHEAAGERLLLQHGCSASLARICRTHGNWDDPEIALEDRLVALADYLWRGVRRERLELLVTQQLADRLDVERWEVFVMTDPIFEAIAAGSAERLSQALT